jgi:hypothetical protein
VRAVGSIVTTASIAALDLALGCAIHEQRGIGKREWVGRLRRRRFQWNFEWRFEREP